MNIVHTYNLLVLIIYTQFTILVKINKIDLLVFFFFIYNFGVILFKFHVHNIIDFIKLYYFNKT